MVPDQIQSDTLAYCEECYIVLNFWQSHSCGHTSYVIICKKKILPDISGKFRNLEILITCLVDSRILNQDEINQMRELLLHVSHHC